MIVIKVALGTFIGMILALYMFPNLPLIAKAGYERQLEINREDNASWLRQQREQMVQNRDNASWLKQQREQMVQNR
jgi:hypothetical protein